MILTMNGVTGYRFGEFQVSLTDETLHRHGIPVPLQQLPFQMLTILLEEPGRVVLREDIQKRLWGEQNYVQFENGLSVAAAKLREALGEQASSPRYVKTIARKGYQFIGDAVAVPSSAPKISQSEVTATVLPAHAAAPRAAFWRWPVYMAVLLVVGCTVGVWVYISHRTTLIDPRQLILVGPLTNETGNTQFDGIFDISFKLKVRESQYFNLGTLETSKDSAVAVASGNTTEQSAQCMQNGGKILLTGRLENRVPGYRLVLAAVRCDNGHVIANQNADASTQASIVSSLDSAVQELRRRLGEPENMLERSNAPIGQVTTGSMAALRAFAMGEAKREPATASEAISYYKVAIDLDPEFAMAYAHLGATYLWRGENELSKQAFTSAFRLRNRTTDRERLYIATRYYDSVTGEIPQAIQTYELWVNMFPYDPEPKNSLAHLYNTVVRKPERAIEQSNAAVALNPANVVYNLNLAQAHLGAGDYAYLNRRCIDPNFPGARAFTFHELCYISYSAQGNEEGIKREFANARAPLQKAAVLDEAGWVAASRGHVAESRSMFETTREEVREGKMPDYAAQVLMDQAIMESECGLKEQAKRDVRKAISEDPLSSTAKGLGALVLARSGDNAGAIQFSAEAVTRSPLDTVLNQSILGSTRAILALNAGDGKRALESLEGSRPYDFSTITNLAPAYYRGLAYEQENDWTSAAREFQSVLDNHSILPNSLFVPLAKLELGHALVELGNEDQANKILNELDVLWGKADKDFGPLMRLKAYEQQAKAKSVYK